MIRVASLLLVALLSACAGQPTEPDYYLLRTDQDIVSRPMLPSAQYVLGSVTIAPYIDQRGLLLETADGDIRPARYHLWAEPLYEGARILLMTEISRASGQDILPTPAAKADTHINIRIDQLHGTADGRARLVAYWALQSGDTLVAAYQYAEYKDLGADGYAALAQAEKELLTDLADQIAATLAAPATAAGE